MPEPGRDAVALAVVESSQVGDARRQAGALARAIGFDAVDQGKLAIIVTELANNLVRHAARGELILRATRGPARAGLDIIAVDRGPGVADFRRCLADGYSTGGTSGTGLGAVVRLCDDFDVYSTVGAGTVIAARFLLPHPKEGERPAARPGLDLGAVCLPMPGEVECGDAWAHLGATPGVATLIVADGLGHGPTAAEASAAAIEVFRRHPFLTPAEHLGAIHPALKGTRGAAVAVAAVDRDRGELRFAGVGNIAGTVFDAAGGHRGLVSHNGTVGGTMPKVQEFALPWPDGALLVLHSDGLTTSWRLDDHALRSRAPGVIAGTLYRDHGRGRDDVTVVVARDEGGPAAWT